MRNYDRINELPQQVSNTSAPISSVRNCWTFRRCVSGDRRRHAADHVTIYDTLPLMGGQWMRPAMQKMAIQAGANENSKPTWSVSGTCAARCHPCRRPADILDESHRANVLEPIHCHFRLMEKQGKQYDSTAPDVAEDAGRMQKLLLTRRPTSR